MIDWKCDYCEQIITKEHKTYCWPSDKKLISSTSESREDMKKQGYNAELAHFRLEYVRTRELIGQLLKHIDDRLSPAAYAAFRAKRTTDCHTTSEKLCEGR